MSAAPSSKAAVEAVELHFYRDANASAFLVVVPDAALIHLNKGHAFRGLTIAFNGLGKKSHRLELLAKAVKEAEGAGIVRHVAPPAGRIRRAGQSACGWVVSVVYPVARWFKAQRGGGGS